MIDKIREHLQSTNIETHPLYYNGQFVADINETQLFNLRLMLLEQATPESVAKGERTGYYLLDDGGEDYHLLSNGYLENINTFWFGGEAKYSEHKIALLEAEKCKQHQAFLDSQVSMQTRHENYMKAEKELEKLKSELNLYRVRDSKDTEEAHSISRFGTWFESDELIAALTPLPEGIAHFRPDRTMYSPDSSSDYLLVVVYDQKVFDKWAEEGCYLFSKLNKTQ